MIISALLFTQTYTHPAIYRCPTKEAESEYFEDVIDGYGFNRIAIDGTIGPNARAAAKGKIKLESARGMDSKANRAWRQASLDFLNGKISPKHWVETVSKLKTTANYLSSPKTKSLREETGEKTGRAVQGEMLVLTWKGTPCINSTDIGKTRPLPPAGRLQSWFLGMRDYLGPTLYLRSEIKPQDYAKLKVIRADSKPGLLIYEVKKSFGTVRFHFNNGEKPIPMPDAAKGNSVMQIGFDFEKDPPEMLQNGFFIVDTTQPEK